VTTEELVVGYAALATTVQPAAINPVIADDPNDDAVLACAVAAQAQVIVSGDPHLLGVKEYERISILTAVQLLAELAERKTTSAASRPGTGDESPSSAAPE
jgi:predicted nucleic acid-binding protein